MRFSIAVMAFCICISLPPTAIQAESPIGHVVSDFSLDNVYGKSVSLSDFHDRKLIAVVFLGTECPLAKLYGPRLAKLQDDFGDMGVQVIGIDSNKQDSLTEMLAYSQKHDLNFPFLKDVGNKVADLVGAKRTPEVFLIDNKQVVRYHGRIDDQYGVGYSRERQAEPDLANAIQQHLDDQPIANALTDAVGCHIGRIKTVQPTGEITFNKHIAPIFFASCTDCHRDGEIAPFTLTSYEDVLGWEDTILEVIDDQRMPPWSADPAHGTFANDARLSQAEKDLIETWVDNGMPEGAPADLPALPDFVPGWKFGKPDEIIAMRDKPFQVPAEGVVDYQYFVVDPHWDEDKYVVASEARPENRSVVHHIIVYVMPPGEKRPSLRRMLVGYAPGSLPVVLNDGIAMHVPAGSKLLFEVHYTPNGTVQSDRSYVGFRFTEKENVKKHLIGGVAADGEFEIPPNAPDHEVFASHSVNRDTMLLSMTPHMHLRGKAFRYEARYPDGRLETLLNVPKYDFNWQLKYILETPKLLPKGTAIECTAVFDNSDANPFNPNPDVAVKWGDQSFNEMMIGFMDMVAAD